jgi:ankyrin repeat protein
MYVFNAAKAARRTVALVLVAVAGLCGNLAHAADSIDTMAKGVSFDDTKGMTRWLAQGVDPNTVDRDGTPFIVLAAREKSDGVVRVLAANPKTDLDKLDAAGENAMMLAALNGDIEMVKLLIDKEAEINKTGWTPLHYAATNGHDDIVKLLLDNSAYIDAGSPNGTTPLMMAARGGHVSTIKLLLDEGADPSIQNQLKLSAVDFARQNNETAIADDLTVQIQKWREKAAQAPAAHPAAP